MAITNDAKVVLTDGTVLVDLTADTIKADKLLKGYTAHGSDGKPLDGTCTYDADTSDATATEDDALEGTIFYKKGVRTVGRMKNNGTVDGVISVKDEEYTIPYGFHDGGGSVGIAEEEKAKLIPSNIRAGVTILDVEGTMSGEEGITAQAKEVSPSFAEQTILPDEGFDYLSQVKVGAIKVTRTENSTGGTTVTIG